MKYGTVRKIRLLAYNALGLQIFPEESLRENKIIFVSTNFPDDMESFNASRNEGVQVGIGSTSVRSGRCRPCVYQSGAGPL